MKRQKAKTNNFKRTTIRRLIILGVLVLLFVVMILLKNSQTVCEFFARTFSRAWIFIFGNLFGWLPFSLYELFLIVVIVGAIVFVVLEIVFLAKHKWRSLLSAALIVTLSVFTFLNIYTATASFSYGRDELPTEVYSEYSGDDLTFDEAVSLAEKIINQVNADYRATDHDADGNIIYPYTFREVSNMLAEEYKRLESNYFSSYTPRGKKIINKTIMSEMGITGVFFAPFGEANVNGYEVRNMYFPHTLAHELAHGKGVMREYEANLVASYICLTSDNPYLRYGALVYHIWDALEIVNSYPNSYETYKQLYAQIDEGIWQERSNYFAFYQQFDTLDRIGNFFNDLYLKLNKQEDGTGSYFKPGENVDTGEKDDDGFTIVQVIKFSGNENLLIKLFKENRL
ncbi:MAG: DUF3810 domain-containing protein [Clostridiales bacterium]|nr:DUF3810 domain-containing protein [Clostridiales bacterium]